MEAIQSTWIFQSSISLTALLKTVNFPKTFWGMKQQLDDFSFPIFQIKLKNKQTNKKLYELKKNAGSTLTFEALFFQSL